MNKTISITIAGLIFHVEEPAYRQLESWLSAVKNHFKPYDDSEEIIRDIENRVAEILSHRSESGRKAVRRVDVEEIIRQIGTVEDFEFFEADAGRAGQQRGDRTGSPREEGTEAGSPKRLFRDPDNAVFGGVAAGVAAYFGLDITLVRLIFVLLGIFWGLSILVYLILWLVMPAARTPAQKLQMKGEPVTLAGLEQKIRSSVPPPEEITSSFGRFWNRAITLLREAGEKFISFLQRTAPLFLTTAGGVLIAAGVLAALVLVILFVAMLAGTSDAWLGVSLLEFSSGAAFHYMILISLFLLSLIPALLILLAGLQLIGARRPRRPAPIALTLIGLWVIALLIAGILVVLEGPVWTEKVQTWGSSLPRHEQVWDVGEFDRIRISGSMDVLILPSLEHFVRGTGTREDLGRGVRVEVSGDELTVHHDRDCFFCPGRELRMEIGIPSPGELRIRGAVNARVNDFMLEKTKLTISGASNVEFASDADTLASQVSGASRVRVTGEIAHADVRISGASSMTLERPLRSLNLQMSGASRVEAKEIQDSISARISGGSVLEYQGDPSYADVRANPGSAVISR